MLLYDSHELEDYMENGDVAASRHNYEIKVFKSPKGMYIIDEHGVSVNFEPKDFKNYEWHILTSNVDVTDGELALATLREKTKSEKIEAFFWLAFWFIIVGGCTASNIFGG